jgi:hypothetical protein
MLVLTQGSAHLCKQLQADLAKQLQQFERAALRSSLSIPAGLILESSSEAEERVFTAEDEERLDNELDSLRRQIQQVRFPSLLKSYGSHQCSCYLS